VIHSVTNEIGDNLTQPGLIALDRRWRELTGQAKESNVPGGVKRSGVLDGVGGQHGEVDRPSFQGALAVQPGEQQQVLDQTPHPDGLIFDAAHRAGDILGLADGPLTEQLGIPPHCGQRGAQLMRRISDELAHPDL